MSDLNIDISINDIKLFEDNYVNIKYLYFKVNNRNTQLVACNRNKSKNNYF